MFVGTILVEDGVRSSDRGSKDAVVTAWLDERVGIEAVVSIGSLPMLG